MHMKTTKRQVVEWHRNTTVYLGAYDVWCLTSVAVGPRKSGKERTRRIPHNGMTDHSQEGWIRPVAKEVKCNVDAVIFKDQRCYGVGMCLRGARKVHWSEDNFI